MEGAKGVLDFLQRILGRENAPSKTVAKERLRLVLVHDRADVSPRVFEDLKNDLIKVISKYMEIDSRSLEMELHNSSDAVALVANIPIKRLKRTAGA